MTFFWPFDEWLGRLRLERWFDWTIERPLVWRWSLLFWLFPTLWMADFLFTSNMFSGFLTLAWIAVNGSRNSGRRQIQA